MKRLAGTLLLAVLLAGGAAGQGGEFERVRAQAQSELARALEAHVEWCTGKTLFQARERALLLLLELEPDHAEARKLLGFTREKDGTWKPPAKPRPPKDFDKKLLGEADTRLAAAHGPYVERLWALLEAGALSAAERELAVADVLRFEPDHEHVHALLGEVHDGERWVLPETLTARARREVLRELVKSAFADVLPAEEVPLSARERAFGQKWKAVAVGPVRVVGSVPLDELRLCAQALQALERFAQGVFQVEHELPADLTVFLLADPAQKTSFIEKHPLIPSEARAYHLALEGGGVQGSADFAFWTGDAQRRIDGIVRLVLGYWLSGAFELRTDHGWVYEGFGLFLTRSLVRSRLTWLAQPSKTLPAAEDMALRQRLLDPESNWMEEAHKVLTGGAPPRLVELVKKGASELTTEEVLLANALVTYLLEAHPGEVARMLARVGTGFSQLEALGDATGRTPAELERHLLRWMEERK
jgi:hypothetical protein